MTREALLVRPEAPVPYTLANEVMHRLAERRLADEIPDVVILLEHPPVFTAGRRARPDELLWSPDEVAARGAEVHRIDRGGAFTFHGPGQLVGYPILDLGPKPDAMAHVRRMEEIVIRAAADLGVDLHRRSDVQTGVWHGDEKVCAIGVRLLRARVTIHGFALNCEPDLSWFNGIVACGLPGHGVTSLSRLAGRHITVAEVAPLLVRHLADVFDIEPVSSPGSIADELRPVAV
jgi:lipoyl(octanoyl) transferase